MEAAGPHFELRVLADPAGPPDPGQASRSWKRGLTQTIEDAIAFGDASPEPEWRI